MEEKVALKVLGFSTGSSAGSYALVLEEMDGGRQLLIVIGASGVQAIAFEMEGVVPPRPLTHDLMKNIITAFGSELSEVVITEVRDGTFYAHVDIEGTIVDARPSDAIALAVRYRAPIYVTENVMNEFGIASQGSEGTIATEEELPESLKGMTKLEEFRNQLKEAVEKENYEKAAQLRDEIKKLENGEN